MKLDDIAFEVSVLLGSTSLPLHNSDLQVGDIIVLEQTIENGLVTKVGSTEYFLATAGLVETHKAIIIDERIHT